MSAPHIVIVTGAAGGIGYNIVCELLKKHDACVVATDIVEGPLGGLKEEYKDKMRVVLHYAIPRLRETKGTVVAATSGAGLGPLFSGWGFYGMSKAAVAFNIRQLSLEEKDITAIGISPGLCDTKMIQDLRAGKQEGWTAQDIQDYEKFVAQIPMALPSVTATSYASALVHRTPELSGVIVDYDDPRLPIDNPLKYKSKQNPTNYAEFSPQVK
ncbi:short-chain dehydrogenase reductase [Fusarium agapanthi]|uniref:Short-chain dehydrogenase reductase n=1 Tax=Fusarium agapanthi TaxID=1803897 RepID=A0A9P5E2M8_9HYPO|nr:short-chain dehydrogenase reductase [Fusarium agapanthi]